MEFKKRLADTDWTERQVLVIIEKQIEKKRNLKVKKVSKSSQTSQIP